MIFEDLGQPKVCLSIMGCSIPSSPVDGGSGVNVIMASTIHRLGIHKLEPTSRTIRMANGARVVPVGTLTGLGTWIGGIEFPLNYLVMQPSKPSGYPALLGRPWLYGAGVITDWTKREFRFGRPVVRVTWGEPLYEGETPQEEEWYASDITPKEAESYDDEVYLMQYLNDLTEEEVFSDRYEPREVAVNLIESEETASVKASRVARKEDQEAPPKGAASIT
ncbi:unnamed protein product [Calypogeia fissa]